MILSFVFSDPSLSGSLIKEFTEPQDSYTYIKNSSATATLMCRFEKNRFKVRSFTLYIPPDMNVNWRLLKAEGSDSQRSYQISEDSIDGITSIVKTEKYWLGDIPIQSWSFPSANQASIRVLDASTQTLMRRTGVVLSSATFELTFSRPFAPVVGNIAPSGPMRNDPFREISQLLVSNPEEIPLEREYPESLIFDTQNTGFSYLGNLAGSSSQPVVRIDTRNQDGVLTRISLKSLKDVGFPVSLETIDLITAYHQGKPYPIEILIRSDEPVENGYILIFHPPIQSEETVQDAFFLTIGSTPGTRLKPEESASAFFGMDLDSSTAQSNSRSWDFNELKLEENHPEFYEEKNTLAGPVEVMWKEFRMDGDSVTVDFDLEGYQLPVLSNIPSEASHPLKNIPLVIRMVPPETYKGDCLLEGLLNEKQLAGQKIPPGLSDVVLYIPSESLRSRGNRLALTFKGKIPIFSEQNSGIFLDWIRLPYPAKKRQLRTEEKPIELPNFQLPDEMMAQPVELEIAPEKAWRLYSVGADPGAIKFYKPKAGEQRLSVPSTLQKNHWWMVDPESAREPAGIEKISNESLICSNTQGFDLVVITDHRFAGQLQAYLERYHRQGISTKILTTRQIYDEFFYGIKSIQAIRDCCHFLLTHCREPRPQFLWLVGEARWDPTNQLGSTVEDLVPSPAVQSRGSIHSNDQWYTCLVGEDAFPDLLVARISVGTTEELKHYLDKVQEDQDSFKPDWWRAVGLFLADDGFTEEIESGLRNGLEKVCVPEIIRQETYPLDPYRKFEAAGRVGKEARRIRPDVVRKWSEGARLVEYAGHGGITVWSHEALFKGLNRPDSDVERLSNQGRYSFVTIRSCMSASINWPTFPGEVSVSEALIKAPGRGAIAVLGSSGTEFANDQERFGSKVRAALWNHHLKTISEIRAYAHCQFLLQTPELTGVVNQFMLHADPLLSYDVPEPIDELGFSFVNREKGPELRIEVHSPILPATGQARVYSHRKMIYETAPFRIDSASQVIQIPIPPEIPFRQNLKGAVYLFNQSERRDAIGSRKLEGFEEETATEPFELYRKWVPDASSSVNLEVSDMVIQPTNPVTGEPVVIEVTLANRGISPTRLQHIELKYGETPDTSHFIERELTREISYPYDFYPGDQRTLKWMQSPSEKPAHYYFTLNVNLAGKAVQRTGSVDITAPPEIEVLSIQPEHPEQPCLVSEPLRFRIDVRNKGGIPTEPLRLMGQNLKGNDFFKVSLPCLAPDEATSATFEVDTPASRFEWETRIDLMPTAYTSRTRWKRQSFIAEAQRALSVKIDREWQEEFEDSTSLAPFTWRYFSPGNLTMQINDEARYRDIPPMNLDLLETGQVRSATHAGIAAWQYQSGWWLSPFQIQAHPLWLGAPLDFRLVWAHESATAFLSPKYYKQDNYQNLGFPMPWMTLSCSQCQFEVKPGNTDQAGHFPEQMIELQSPGIDWGLKNHPGAWPGFAGFRLGVLAEIRTPVIDLQEDARWNAGMSFEWHPKPPEGIIQQVRSGAATDSLGGWSSLSSDTIIQGKAIQLRTLIRPDEEQKGALVRSLMLKVMKAN